MNDMFSPITSANINIMLMSSINNLFDKSFRHQTVRKFGFHGGVGFHRDWRIENRGLGFRMEERGFRLREEPWVGFVLQ